MKSKSKIYGIIGTVMFHVLMFLILWTFALTAQRPIPEEQGVEIAMAAEVETRSGGGGGSSPNGSNNRIAIQDPNPISKERPSAPVRREEPVVVTQPKETTQQAPINQEEPVAAQTTEESIAASSTPKQEIPPQPVVDNRAIYKPKQPETTTGTGGNSANGTGSGYGTGHGNGIGDGIGNGIGSGSGNGIGNGHGDGEGDGWYLRGRKKLYLEKPEYNSKEQGIVVVEIIVDRSGKVVRATPGVKVPEENISTTVSDQVLWTLAKNAALQSKFSSNPKAPEGQKGYIVYDFIKSH